MSSCRQDCELDALFLTASLLSQQNSDDSNSNCVQYTSEQLLKSLLWTYLRDCLAHTKSIPSTCIYAQQSAYNDSARMSRLWNLQQTVMVQTCAWQQSADKPSVLTS